MKIVMTSYYTGPKGDPDLRPGDSFEFDDTEAARIVSNGGARLQTAAEIAADAAALEAATKVAADRKAAADAAAAAAAAAKK